MLNILFLVAVASAQQYFYPYYGGQNKEYSGLGKYVTVFDEYRGYGMGGYNDNYGASVIGSKGDITTFVILPTKLNLNQTKFAGDYATAMTVGPTTVAYFITQERTHTDVIVILTYSKACSFSGSTTAVCISSIGDLPRSCYGVESMINTSTYTSNRIGFQTYEIVTKTTTIKDTDPEPTTLVNESITYWPCVASSTAAKEAKPAATPSSSESVITTPPTPSSEATSSSTEGSVTSSIPSTAGKRSEVAGVVLLFAAAALKLGLW